MTRLNRLLPVLPALALAASANAQETRTSAALDELRRAAPGSAEAAALMEGLKSVSLEELLSAAAEMDRTEPGAPRPEAGWSGHEAVDEQGVARPYQLYVPASVAEGGSMKALVVHMHGAVARPEFGEGLGSLEACGYAPLLWPELADKHGLVIAAPQGRSDCTWWSQAGHQHVDAVIRDVRRSFMVPERGVIGAGFSDGGSGCYHRAMTDPGPFSGFIALNGHPAVASLASEDQIDLRNLASTPIFAATTHLDSLYPSRHVVPHLASAIEHGARITLLAVPDITHQPSYFGEQHAAILGFIEKAMTSRPARALTWVHSAGVSPEVHWIEILATQTTGHDAVALEPIQHMTRPGRVRLGVDVEPGTTKVSLIMEGSVADGAGMLVGDRIDGLNGVAVTDARSLRAAVRTLSHGAPFELELERAGEPTSIRWG